VETRLDSIDVPVKKGQKKKSMVRSVLIIGNEPDFVENMKYLDDWRNCRIEVVLNENEAVSKLKGNGYSMVLICGKGGVVNPELLKAIRECGQSMPVFHLRRIEDCETDRFELVKSEDESGEISIFVDPNDRADCNGNLNDPNRYRLINSKLIKKPIKNIGMGELVGVSSAMQQVYEKIIRASQVNSIVLLHGESGTGKELAARAIHDNSDRKNNPFIPVNCSAIPDNLLESELFGYVRGAFSGAVANTQGILKTASSGTVFFDEIGELDIRLQAKLLRFVEDRIVKPLGSNKSYEIDVKIIVATNRDLLEEIHHGRFRQDFFYRINILPINMPSLRTKREDIPLLVDHFLKKYGKGDLRVVRGISTEALSAFFQYHWPGNVREMENLIQQAIIMGSGPILTLDNFPSELTHKNLDQLYLENEGIPTLKEVEKELISKALEETKGNVTSAAKLLGIDRKTIYRKVKRLSITT
jgi:two-component system response regulator AtoC